MPVGKVGPTDDGIEDCRRAPLIVNADLGTDLSVGVGQVAFARAGRAISEVALRTTLALDDELVAEAQRLTGTEQKAALVREALQALIERESARRLAQLGGVEPGLEPAPRRRAAID